MFVVWFSSGKWQQQIAAVCSGGRREAVAGNDGRLQRLVASSSQAIRKSAGGGVPWSLWQEVVGECRALEVTRRRWNLEVDEKQQQVAERQAPEVSGRWRQASTLGGNKLSRQMPCWFGVWSNTKTSPVHYQTSTLYRSGTHPLERFYGKKNQWNLWSSRMFSHLCTFSMRYV